MARTDWASNKADILRICAEELASGVHGYLDRAVSRINGELSLPVNKKGLDNFLQRESAVWSPIHAKVMATGAAVAVPEEELPADHPVLRDKERHIQGLKDQITGLKRKLREADRQGSVVQAVVDVLRSELRPFEPLPPRPPSKDHGATGVDLVALLSDEHADHVISPEVTWGLERYDFNVFRARLQRWVEVVESFVTEHLPLYDFHRMWVFSLGDKLQGSIHDMKLRNHFANDLRAMQAVIDAEADAYRRLAPLFPGGLHIVGVGGNHTRTTQKPQNEDPHDNLDFAINCGVARRLESMIDAGQVSVILPRSWTAFVDVRGWRFALNHGEDVKGHAGFPWYGFDKREGRVRSLYNVASDGDSIDYFVYGHYHTPTTRTGADYRSIHNGAFFMTDPFAVKALAVGCAPEQTLMVFRDKKPDQGHVFNIPVYLRDRDREELLARGKWNPSIGQTTILDRVCPSELSPHLIGVR